MKNPQLEDLLEAIQIFSQKVDQRFERMNERFELIDKRFERIEQRMSESDQRIESLEHSMVTKNYFNYQLADFKGELQIKLNRLERKFDSLVGILRQKAVIDGREFTKINRL